MIVDDQEFNVKIIGDLLTMAMGLKKDENFITAFDGQQALDLVKSFGKHNPIEVILMDLSMPVMDGFDSSRLIMEYCREKNTQLPKIYAFTASDSTDILM